MEFALAGLLSSLVVAYRFWAAKLDIPLDDVQVDVEGDLDVRGFFGLRAAGCGRPALSGARPVLQSDTGEHPACRGLTASGRHHPAVETDRQRGFSRRLTG